MQRHPVLQKLTEDHHHTLVQAKHLRAVTEATVAGRIRALLSAWRREIEPHFLEEELALLPTVCPPVDPRHPLLTEVLAEHLTIRRTVMDLQAAQQRGDPPAAVTLCQRLGEALDAHIRLEEREVFELLQASLDDAQLTALGARLAAWESASRALVAGEG